MNTLIIPCAGRSSRFPNMRPKWMLLYPDGNMMVKKAIEGVELNIFDRIIITILQEHIDKFNAKEILNNIFDFENSNRYELCVLEEPTSCQAETVYETLVRCNVEGQFSVKDSDNYIKVDSRNQGEYIASLNINSFHKEIGRLGGKSFLVVNEQGIITDIIEKRIVSENICVGMYGFEDAKKFEDAYNHMREVSDKRYEIYLSHIIAYLIGTKKSVYRNIEVADYEDWGTIKDWNIVLNEKKTVILNIDGILFEKNEKFFSNVDWNESLIPIKENIDKVKEIVKEGAQLILLTSMPETYKDMVVKSLSDIGIEYYQIIFGCYISHEILIKKAEKTIPYPGGEVVNVSANSYIGDYM